VCALWSPATGIVGFVRVAEALAADVPFPLVTSIEALAARYPVLRDLEERADRTCFRQRSSA
jgi:hypothetical protein